MNGDGFTAYVKPGDQVKAGDRLIAFDLEKIKAAGHPAVTIMVVTNPGDVYKRQELVNRIYEAVGRETRARGGHQAFTPVLDLGRDPRFGRLEETFGEDTFLTSQMGCAAVKGLQKNVVSTVKHFAGYGQCSGGRNFAPSFVGRRELLDEILPPFRAAVEEGGAMGVMPSHCDVDGIPCHQNRELLDDILRKQWGFKGIVAVSYTHLVGFPHTQHGIVGVHLVCHSCYQSVREFLFHIAFHLS